MTRENGTWRRALAVFIAGALLASACNGSSDESIASGSTAPVAEPPGTGAPGDPTSSTAPSTAPDAIGELEAATERAPNPGPGDLGASWSGSLLRATGDFDSDMIAAVEDAETMLLTDASTQIDAEAIGAPSSTVPTATTAPQGFRRRQQAGGGFGTIGAILVGLSDDLASRPSVQASAAATAPADGPKASGTLTFGLGGGTDASGSNTAQMSMKIEVTSDDGRTASVDVTAGIAGQPCPQDDGVLEMRFDGTASGEWKGASAGHANQQFRGTLTAHFDDEGEASSVDLDIHIETSRSGAADESSYVDFTYTNRITGLFGSAPTESSSATINRTSSKVDANNSKDRQMVDDARQAAVKFALGAFATRRSRVQHNGCVIVEATGPSIARAGEQVRVDVHTRHVVEGIELDKRVDATLSGAGSIDPEHLPDTPRGLIYTAGDQAGDTGTIALESRSKRGIGRTSITIGVRPGYRIDQPVGDLHLQGILCGLDQVFVLESLAPATGLVTFTPSGPGGGTYAGHGQVDTTDASIEWSGTYSIDTSDPEHPTIRMDEGTTTMVNVPVIGEAPLPGFWSGGVTFEPIPEPTACASPAADAG